MNIFAKGVLTLTAIFTLSAAPAKAQWEWLVWKEVFESSPPPPSETRRPTTPMEKEDIFLALGMGGSIAALMYSAIYKTIFRRKPEEKERPRKDRSLDLLREL